jgi:phosphate/sulfate permease
MNDAPRSTTPPVRVYGAPPRSQGSDSNPLSAGVLTGVLSAVAWTLLVYVTHNPVSLAGWGVGGLIGIVVAKSPRRDGASLGPLAVILTIGTVVLAKALILAFALGPIVRDEIVRNRGATTALFLLDMTTHRSFSPDLQGAIDQQGREGPDTARTPRRPRRMEQAFELSERIMAEARARDSAATAAEREQLVRTYSDSLLAREGFLPMLGRAFSFWDLLWLGLGVSSAWQLTRGSAG